jgi:hypothetical protein
MSTGLKLSLVANVMLAAVAGYLAARPQAEAPAPAIAATEAPGPVADPPSPQPESQPAWSRRFDWHQLETADYPTYIANLRAIKCPEQTVRDIISADVAHLFAVKRKQLSGSPARAGRWSPAAESMLVAALFADPVGSQPSSAPPGSATPKESEPARMPLLFQTQALASLGLSDEQREELGELAQQFIQEIGGANQNPNDPTYLARWQQAQPKFDALIVNVIGRRALVNLDQAMPPEAGTQ